MKLFLTHDYLCIFRYNRTLNSYPQLSGQANTFEVFEPFNQLKKHQHSKLSPDIRNADVLTVERDVINRDTTMGTGSMKKNANKTMVKIRENVIKL